MLKSGLEWQRPITLRERIQLQRPRVVDDAYNANEIEWVNVGDPVWAKVEPTGGDEVFEGGAELTRDAVMVVIRWRSDVGASWRIVWGGVEYDIRERPRNEDQRRQYIVFIAEEVA